jgi:hypothetical protein
METAEEWSFFYAGKRHIADVLAAGVWQNGGRSEEVAKNVNQHFEK